MPYMDNFNSIVTTTKKNNRFYGPTESNKMASFLSEVKADLNTIYNEINNVSDQLEALASGYLEFAGASGTLPHIKNSIYDFESIIDSQIYVESEQTSVF